MNAEETLDFYGRLFNMPAQLRRQRTADLIDMVGLTWAKRRQLKEYSKGMTRRIGLAQALINDPELIVLDEPTTGLDPIGTREMKDLIIRLKEQGKTVLMCSHLLADVQDVCDRIGILYQGEMKELGRVDSLLAVRDVTEIHAKGLNDAAKNEIREVISRHSGELLSLGNPTTTLEELFLEIIKESEAPPRTSRARRHVRMVIENPLEEFFAWYKAALGGCVAKHRLAGTACPVPRRSGHNHPARPACRLEDHSQGGFRARRSGPDLSPADLGTFLVGLQRVHSPRGPDWVCGAVRRLPFRRVVSGRQ